MDESARAEYKALRATIRERGTVRVITFFVALCVWAALELACIAHPSHVVVPLLPLLVLVAGFEAVFQLHLGIERIGRYLQVAFEACPERRNGLEGPGWETVAMAYGKAYPGSGSDPLFAPVFLLAAFVDIVPLASMFWVRELYGGLVLAHVAFLVRVVLARRQAARQRAQDLERFRNLLGRTS